jgi:hypothetical protein
VFARNTFKNAPITIVGDSDNNQFGTGTAAAPQGNVLENASMRFQYEGGTATNNTVNYGSITGSTTDACIVFEAGTSGNVINQVTMTSCPNGFYTATEGSCRYYGGDCHTNNDCADDGAVWCEGTCSSSGAACDPGSHFPNCPLGQTCNNQHCTDTAVSCTATSQCRVCETTATNTFKYCGTAPTSSNFSPVAPPANASITLVADCS